MLQSGLLQLRVVRIVKRLTIWDLAQKAGVVASRLSMIERGVVVASEEERERIARVIGGSPAVLFAHAVDPCDARSESPATM
jgi:transcriptional regulator with XRE-family HTH domain